MPEGSCPDALRRSLTARHTDPGGWHTPAFFRKTIGLYTIGRIETGTRHTKRCTWKTYPLRLGVRRVGDLADTGTPANRIPTVLQSASGSIASADLLGR